ncbi:YbaB/EbfC family nucleoid-associated protein [Actinomadura sp. ATCC 39365]|uniref:YbaB/EbfC family nucleoid-associated protein n=1 Tax=Nonomuraea sp. NPDC005692 TaxID=3157168 RepID=UPI0033C9CDA9
MFGPQIDPANISERELDEAARQGERMLAWLESAHDELRAVTGTGEGPSGHVRVTVDADGRVLDVRYGPRALRLGGQDLAEETLAAVRAAAADVRRRTHDLMREAVPGYDPDRTQAELERLLGAEWA